LRFFRLKPYKIASYLAEVVLKLKFQNNSIVMNKEIRGGNSGRLPFVKRDTHKSGFGVCRAARRNRAGFGRVGTRI
jgi:hypothetical protein